MLKKLDNSLSVDIDEINYIFNNFAFDFDCDEALFKYFEIFQKYTDDKEFYDEWMGCFNKIIHLSIPKEIKENCKFCNGNSQLEADKACNDNYLNAKYEFAIPVINYVNLIENNPHYFGSKELVKELTSQFYLCFTHQEDKLVFNDKRFNKILLTHILISQREYFNRMVPQVALTEINQLIEELENHKFIAKQTNRVLFDLVKPQLKLLKKERKSLTAKLSNNIIINDPIKSPIDKLELFKKTNKLIPSVSVEQVYNFFQILTRTTNREGIFYLSQDKLLIFVKSTFTEETDQEPIQQSFDVVFSRDKIDVRSVFKKFLDQCSLYEKNQKNLKRKYFDIMNKSFKNFNEIDFEKFHKTNNIIPTIKFDKSK